MPNEQIPVSVETETIQKRENNTLMLYNISRDPEGIRIFLKSKTFEEFFKNNGVLEGDEYKWCGMSPYKVPATLDPEMRQLLNAWNQNSLILSGEYPNLSMLRTQGIGDGVTFTIPAVYSRASIQKFVKIFKEKVKNLYVDYVKPVNCTLEFTISMSGDNA